MIDSMEHTIASWSQKVENAVQMQNVANVIITKPIGFKTNDTLLIEQNFG